MNSGEFLGDEDADLEQMREAFLAALESGKFDIPDSQDSVGKRVLIKDDFSMIVYRILNIKGEIALCINESEEFAESEEFVSTPVKNLVDAEVVLEKIKEILTERNFKKYLVNELLEGYYHPN